MDVVDLPKPDLSPVRPADALPRLTPSERQWEISQVSATATGRRATEEMLLAQGWEPYGADAGGSYFRRRTLKLTRAVVVSHIHRDGGSAARDLFAGWHVIVAQSLSGVLQRYPNLQFDRIVMMWRPEGAQQSRWFYQVLKPRLDVAGELEWLF